MNLKDISVGIFANIVTDQKLIDLLKVPLTLVGGIPVNIMDDIKYQILEDKYPNDLVVNSLSRLCVYENPSTTPFMTHIERCFIEIDIYVTKEKNKVDRRVLLIANRLFDIFHNKIVEGRNIRFYNRLPNLPSDNNEWVKYGMVFNYDNIIL